MKLQSSESFLIRISFETTVPFVTKSKTFEIALDTTVGTTLFEVKATTGTQPLPTWSQRTGNQG